MESSRLHIKAVREFLDDPTHLKYIHVVDTAMGYNACIVSYKIRPRPFGICDGCPFIKDDQKPYYCLMLDDNPYYQSEEAFEKMQGEIVLAITILLVILEDTCQSQIKEDDHE